MSCKCSICGYESDVPLNYKDWFSLSDLHIDIYPITQKGEMDDNVINFICAKCLRNANKMKVMIKLMRDKIAISDSLVNNFMDICEAQLNNKDKYKLHLLKQFKDSELIDKKKEKKLYNYLTSTFGDYVFHSNNDYIFIIKQNKDVKEIVGVKSKKKRNFPYYLAINPNQIKRNNTIMEKLEQRGFKDVKISLHALERFKTRSKTKSIKDSDIANEILNLFSLSERILFKKSFMTERLINHNFNEVEYYVKKKLVFVTTTTINKLIITIEKLGNKTINKDFHLINSDY